MALSFPVKDEISFRYSCLYSCCPSIIAFWLSTSATSDSHSFLFLSSSAIPDQTQVLCIHQAAISGGSPGSFPGSSAPSRVFSPPTGSFPHCAGPPYSQVWLSKQKYVCYYNFPTSCNLNISLCVDGKEGQRYGRQLEGAGRRSLLSGSLQVQAVVSPSGSPRFFSPPHLTQVERLL